MFENPRRGKEARNFTTNVPKILDLKSSSEQIFFENWRWVPLCFCRRLLRVARVTWIETWKTGPIFSSFNSALAKIINKLLWLVLPGKFVLYLQNSTGALGSSIKDDGNEDGKKAIGLDWLAKEKLCTCITLFYTFPCCRCMTTVWNCLILRFVVDVNTIQWPSFSFSEL